MHVTGVLTRTISPARRTALAVLAAVAEGEYASDILRERSQQLSGRDAALARQIVFGCLRFQGQLDFLIAHYSGRPPDDLDTAVRLALRVAIYQLRYLTRVPPHAAVHEAVEFVKSNRRAAAAFTNAVLRKVDRRPVAWPNAATELSCPSWLLDRWSAHFGEQVARGIAAAALEEPAAFVRVAAGSPLPAGLALEPTEVAGAYRVSGDPPPGLRLHDISSQSILPLLDLRPDSRYLDLCAAPGNKTIQALEASPALAVACDISFKRLREMPAVAPRLVLDATAALPLSLRFDRIFIDAPCSGTGTLGRNPEIKWRLRAEELARFKERQLAILTQAATALEPAGNLLYATCSLEQEENEKVVEEFLRLHPSFGLIRELWRLPGREEGDGFYAALLKKENPLKR
jgi:16S rRNA (cytosine967-C5)-methyltransferase